MIEVFGDHGIYIDTIQGVVIEETDEFFVYEFLVNFGNKINKEVTVKVSCKFTSNVIYSRSL